MNAVHFFSEEVERKAHEEAQQKAREEQDANDEKMRYVPPREIMCKKQCDSVHKFHAHTYFIVGSSTISSMEGLFARLA